MAAELVAFGEALNDGTIRAHGPRDASLTPTTFEAFTDELRAHSRPHDQFAAREPPPKRPGVPGVSSRFSSRSGRTGRGGA